MKKLLPYVFAAVCSVSSSQEIPKDYKPESYRASTYLRLALRLRSDYYNLDSLGKFNHTPGAFVTSDSAFSALCREAADSTGAITDTAAHKLMIRELKKLRNNPE